MSHCTSFFNRLGTLLTFGKYRSNRDFVGERVTPIRLSINHPNTFESLCKVLQKLAEHPRMFIRTVYSGSKATVFVRLFHLEACIDSGLFTDTLVSINRDEIDAIVPYEYQNVRAYFYYLILKARIQEHKATHVLGQLIDASHYCFNFEKIVAEVRENCRVAGRLLVFFSYFHAGDNLELGHSILRQRMTLFEHLFEENICLIIFLLTHFDQMEGKEPGKELMGLLSGFKSLAERYSTEFRNLKLGLAFDDRVKALTGELVNPLILLAQKIVFLKQESPQQLAQDLTNLQRSINRYQKMRAKHQNAVDVLQGMIEKRMAVELRRAETMGAVPKGKREKRSLKMKRASTNFEEDDARSHFTPERPRNNLSAKKSSRRQYFDDEATDAHLSDHEYEFASFDFDKIFGNEERPRLKSHADMQR